MLIGYARLRRLVSAGASGSHRVGRIDRSLFMIDWTPACTGSAGDFGLVVLGEDGVEPGADQAAERDLQLLPVALACEDADYRPLAFVRDAWEIGRSGSNARTTCSSTAVILGFRPEIGRPDGRPEPHGRGEWRVEGEVTEHEVGGRPGGGEMTPSAARRGRGHAWVRSGLLLT